LHKGPYSEISPYSGGEFEDHNEFESHDKLGQIKALSKRDSDV
jgi:hypothetical protein